MSNEPFVIERIYSASPARVWKAITDNNDMQQWYFKLADFKPEVGFEFTFEGGDEKQTYVHLCRITAVEKERKLTYTWSYEGYEGMSEVTWELFPEGTGTKLRLTHTGLETFPQNNPSFRKESFAKGWTYITGESLAKFLEKE